MKLSHIILLPLLSTSICFHAMSSEKPDNPISITKFNSELNLNKDSINARINYDKRNNHKPRPVSLREENSTKTKALAAVATAAFVGGLASATRDSRITLSDTPDLITSGIGLTTLAWLFSSSTNEDSEEQNQGKKEDSKDNFTILNFFFG